jgi:hypothetical protein
MHHFAIECELFDRTMTMQEYSHSGAFIYSARFDSNVAILDQVNAPDAMTSTDFVGSFDDARGRESFTVYRDRIAN